MIDPATSGFEIKQVQIREAHTVASVVEQSWHTQHPRPKIIVVFDKGTELMGDFSNRLPRNMA
jgi:hypothetical protein